jgi:hypothetical protein
MMRASKLLAMLAMMAVMLWASGTAGTATSEPTPFNVTDYGATPNDSTNDSTAFKSAMKAAVQNGGAAYVPGGTYRLTNVALPNHATLQVESAATLKKYGTKSGPLFIMRGPDASTFGREMHVEGVNGAFTLDLYDAGQDTAGFRIRNVDGFSVKNMTCIQNNDNQTQEAPSSRKPCLSFLPQNSTQRADGRYNAPYNGTLENLHAKKSPYGWGLVQITGGRHLDFTNISSQGGIALRFENFETKWTPMYDITANGVRCWDGHEAVGFNPHGATHDGNIHLTNVRAESCESGVGLSGPGTYGPNVTIDGLTVVPGSNAQIRDPDPNQTYVGAWLISNSKWCVKDQTNAYTVTTSGAWCNGLRNR